MRDVSTSQIWDTHVSIVKGRQDIDTDRHHDHSMSLLFQLQWMFLKVALATAVCRAASFAWMMDWRASIGCFSRVSMSFPSSERKNVTASLRCAPGLMTGNLRIPILGGLGAWPA